MLKLTPRQAEILAFIKRCLEDNGYPPTRAAVSYTHLTLPTIYSV